MSMKHASVYLTERKRRTTEKRLSMTVRRKIKNDDGTYRTETQPIIPYETRTVDGLPLKKPLYRFNKYIKNQAVDFVTGSIKELKEYLGVK